VKNKITVTITIVVIIWCGCERHYLFALIILYACFICILYNIHIYLYNIINSNLNSQYQTCLFILLFIYFFNIDTVFFFTRVFHGRAVSRSSTTRIEWRFFFFFFFEFYLVYCLLFILFFFILVSLPRTVVRFFSLSLEPHHPTPKKSFNSKKQSHIHKSRSVWIWSDKPSVPWNIFFFFKATSEYNAVKDIIRI